MIDIPRDLAPAIAASECAASVRMRRMMLAMSQQKLGPETQTRDLVPPNDLTEVATRFGIPFMRRDLERLRAPNKTYDNPSAFNASCTFGRAFMRSMKALTCGKGERSNSTRGAQRATV
jgi:hypothetical protein